jgi:class 3 adenylate cyclase
VSRTRRLAAILAADVAGYSRLMGADEEGTLERLKALRRELLDPKIAEHHGRIVKTTGDGMSVEYLAGFHAAQALAKSHSGVRSSFARLVKEDPLKAPLAGRPEYHRSQFSQRRPSIRENSPSLSVTTI